MANDEVTESGDEFNGQDAADEPTGQHSTRVGGRRRGHRVALAAATGVLAASGLAAAGAPVTGSPGVVSSSATPASSSAPSHVAQLTIPPLFPLPQPNKPSSSTTGDFDVTVSVTVYDNQTFSGPSKKVVQEITDAVKANNGSPAIITIGDSDHPVSALIAAKVANDLRIAGKYPAGVTLKGNTTGPQLYAYTDSTKDTNITPEAAKALLKLSSFYSLIGVDIAKTNTEIDFNNGNLIDTYGQQDFDKPINDSLAASLSNLIDKAIGYQVSNTNLNNQPVDVVISIGNDKQNLSGKAGEVAALAEKFINEHGENPDVTITMGSEQDGASNPASVESTVAFLQAMQQLEDLRLPISSIKMVADTTATWTIDENGDAVSNITPGEMTLLQSFGPPGSGSEDNNLTFTLIGDVIGPRGDTSKNQLTVTNGDGSFDGQEFHVTNPALQSWATEPLAQFVTPEIMQELTDTVNRLISLGHFQKMPIPRPRASASTTPDGAPSR